MKQIGLQLKKEHKKTHQFRNTA